MRPARLVLEGFTSFTDLTEVDFGDTDLFALSGPTGAGKSSLVDAMVFALYGRVPRLDGRVVAPLIALRRTEARVGFEFTVGSERYSAVRVLRRTRTGASTKQAVLERAGEVVASGEREVSDAVESLLGLGYDHFTSCVVLPQGEFATLLHATPGDRQDLLVSLLHLGLYDRMRDVARRRLQEATAEVATADGILRTLAAATPEARGAVAERLVRLQAVRDEADDAHVRLRHLRAERDAATADAEAVEREVALLTRVRPPEGLADHSEALAAAREAVEAQDEQADALDRAIDDAAAQLAELPTRSTLEAAAKAHRDLTEHTEEHAELAAKLVGAAEALAAADLAVESATNAHASAQSELEAVKRQHQAHVLADSLSLGEPCPVCSQHVSELPDLGEVDDLTAADAAVHAAVKGLDAARRRQAEANRVHARVDARLASVVARVEALEVDLAEHRDPVEVVEQLTAVAELEEALRRARLAAKRARAEATSARGQIAAIEAAEDRERRRFDDTRDSLVALGPPVPQRHDLAADWRALVAWAADEHPRCAELAEAAAGRARDAEAARAELVDELAERAGAVGVEPEGPERDVRGPLASAVGACAAQLERLDQDLATCEHQRDRRDAAERRATLAKELTRLLKADQFEKWVLDEALTLLVEGATVRLRELTDGAYSLALDARGGFEVVDHRNADERRSARTLSGGETFLAALALALALADQIGALAAGGAARLESMLIDEGFGSLDPDALDTVATAMEELGSQGRVVGLISHIPDLAARMPVRFEVTAGPGGSTVTRSVA